MNEMYPHLYYKCPSCCYSVNVLEGGILESHPALLGVDSLDRPCHMSDQYPLERMSNDDFIYQRWLMLSGEFASVFNGDKVRFYIDKDQIVCQVESKWGMRLTLDDILRMSQPDEYAKRLLAYRIEDIRSMLTMNIS